MVTFQFPAYNPDTTFNLKNPEFEDKVEYPKNITVNISRTGLHRAIKFDMQETKELELNFHYVSKIKVDSFLNFLDLAKNEYIKYTNYDNQSWIVLFQKDTLDIDYINRHEFCDFTLYLIIVEGPL